MNPKKVLTRHSFLHGLIPLVLGYKGHTIMESGYIWAPYIPIIVEEDFRPRQSIRSRYARKIVNNNFYGVVEIGTNT